MPKDDLSAGSLSFRPGRRTPRTVLRISRMVCSNPVGQRKEGGGRKGRANKRERGKEGKSRARQRQTKTQAGGRVTGREWVSG